ncbi:nucleotidyltransferase domain-containing protein [Halorubrum sp. Ea1]|uniref:nucleotidyltransferase domain-containing protein n=1 Tax=Halorubrum sp. Ea1 TaxID=1480718 RepID=UPI0020CE75B1|nr:nucleotidyltransferase domain-containing protein [Halorubrum sp. Ea1]
MEPNADQSQIRSALKDVVCADPDVVFTVVFGSQLSGTATHSSDFDIAVKFTTDCSERDRFKSGVYSLVSSNTRSSHSSTFPILTRSR